jgi:hypothetical protein
MKSMKISRNLCMEKTRQNPQSRQNAKLFLQSSELGLPQPLTPRECAPPRSGGGAHSLTREGVGESQFQRGDILCGTLFMCMYFVTKSMHPKTCAANMCLRERGCVLMSLKRRVRAALPKPTIFGDRLTAATLS